MSIIHRHLAPLLFWLTVFFPLDPSARAQVWTSIGPSPISGNNGPTGSITSLAVDPSDPNHWLIGSAGGGIWSSTNAGALWTPSTDAQPTLSIGSIAFAPSNSQIVYAGTGNANYTGHAQAGQGILKSADGGSTWTLMAAATFLYTSIGAIRVNPSNSSNVEAVMSRAQSGRDNEPFLGPYPAPFGLQVSMDGGATWTITLAGESTSLEIDPTSFNNQFTAISLPTGYGAYNTPAATGVYRSSDGGNTWTLLSGPWSGQSIGRILVALAPSNPNTLYAGVQGSNQHLLGIYRTDNAQAATPTWIQIPTGGTWATLGSNYVDYCGFSCTQTDLIAVNPSNSNILYAGGASLWQCTSCDASAAWTDIGYQQGQWSIPSGKRCLTWSGNLMIACTDGGAFSTATGSGPWQDQNGALSVARLVSGALNPTNPNAALAGAFDNAAALWSGSLTWQSLGFGTGEVALSTTLPTTDMMVSSGSAIFRTTTGGQSFFQETTGFTPSSSLPGFLPVRKCPAVDDVFLTGTSLLQRSNNFFSGSPASWAANGPSGNAIVAIAFAPSDRSCNTYAYGTSGGQVEITYNGGSTWSNLDPDGTLPTRSVNSLAFDPTTTGTLYAAMGGYNAGSAAGGHLFTTVNAGAAARVWTNISPGADLPFNVVAVDPESPSSLYAGTDAAVWYSPNRGAGWEFLGPSAGLPNVPVYDLKFGPATDRLVAFTFGRGAWELNLTGTSPGGPIPTFPAGTSLQATLGSAYSLTFGGNFTYSITGGTLPLGMALLPSGEIAGTPLAAGNYTFTMSATGAAGGVASQTFTLTVGTGNTSAVWTYIGPTPLAYSVAPTVPQNFNSGRVSSIAADPSDATHWLVGYGNGGVWETHDTGNSWTPITDSQSTLAIGAIAFAPSNPNIVYVGTGESDGGVGMEHSGIGLLKSTDGGATWNLLGATQFARAAFKRIRVHPTNPNLLLAGTSRSGYGRDSHEGLPSEPPFGIWLSSDGGNTWIRTLTGQITALEIDPNNFNNQYAAIGEQRYPSGINNDGAGSAVNGVYQSTDGGQTWTPIAGPWGPSNATTSSVGRIELADAPSNPNTLYAGIQAPPNGGSSGTGLLGLYRTDNAWAATPTWISIPAVGDGGYCGPNKCGYSNVLSVDPSDPDTLFAFGGQDDANAGDFDEGDGTFRCSNCGATPTWTYIPGPHTDHHAIAWAGNRLIDGNDGGVWSTNNLGSSWSDHNTGIATNMFYGAALHPTNENFLIAGIRDFSVVQQNGVSPWLILPDPIQEWGEAEVGMSASSPNTNWMAGEISGRINRTTDGGQTVIEVDSPIDNTSSAFIEPVRKCPGNDDVFLAGTNQIYRANNFFSGAMPTWVANSPAGLPDRSPSPATIQSIVFNSLDTTCNTYAYGTFAGKVQLTVNGGATWTNLDPMSTLPPRTINSLVWDPANPNVMYAAISSFDDATPATPGHVFKTTNAMSASPTWTNISPPLNQPFNVIAVDPLNPTMVYAGSDTGLFRSTNGGAAWIAQGLNLGMPNATVHDIEINPATGRTEVFTYGRGAFALGPELDSIAAAPNLGATYPAGGSVPGLWATVAGRDLAGVSRTWAGSDFAPLESGLPANLSGVQVMVNGLAAAVYSISPAQVAFQVPAAVTGTAIVQTLRNGVPSNQVTLVSACDFGNTGVVSVSDLQTVINQALGIGQPLNDLNQDGQVDIVDVQIEAGAALGMGCSGV